MRVSTRPWSCVEIKTNRVAAPIGSRSEMLNESSLAILCDPETHDPLIQQGNALVNPKNNKRFPVRDGLPCFVKDAAGVNRKYQSLYDWIAPFYDAGEHAYFWLTRKASYRVFLRNSLGSVW